MNEHDSEKIAGIFNNDGMTKSDDIDNADVLFVNTCTIRENADDKLYGTLGHLKNGNHLHQIDDYLWAVAQLKKIKN